MNLLERDEDLEKLRQLLQHAAEGHGSLVMLGGEAGVGKTAFVRGFMRDAEGRARILAGACDALSTPRPLGPLADIAADIGGEIERLIEAAASRDQVFGACLRELSGAWRPTVAVFEDVHWADEATLDLLRFLGRRVSKTRALLIATYRDDEVGSAHPLRKVLGDLATAEGVQRLSLAPLSVDAVRQLAAGSELDPIALHHQTGGNPFFVTEVLAAGGGISETVRDAVLTRVSRLSPSAQAALDLAAVAGSPVEASFLERLVDGQIDAIEECLSSGVLRADGQAILFRHELAREAMLSALSPPRRVALHARVLKELESESADRRNQARLAHHAEESNNEQAVLTYATAAAERAAALGAHREAAAQYARALRFSTTLPPDQRAKSLEARAVECYLSDQMREGIEAQQEAIAIWRDLGNRRREGKSLAIFPRLLIPAGQNSEAEAASRAAIELLERLPAGRELGTAYSSQAFVRMLNRDNAEAITWGQRAIALADRFDDIETLIESENVVGSAMILSGDEHGRSHLERSIHLAREAGLDFQAARAYANVGSSFGEQYQFALADHYLIEGIAFSEERDLDYSRWYMTAWQALSLFYQGHWTEAAESAQQVLRQESASAISRIMALIALGRLRSRRGDPEASNALDEALRLSLPTGTLQRLAPVRAARAEAAWLAGDRERGAEEASAAFDLALHHHHRWHVGELGYWLWRAGRLDTPQPDSAEPYALQIAGDWAGAAAAWAALGCPYEEARALVDSDQESDLRSALATFDRLGARPMAALVTKRLRDLGVGRIPRGPRSTTRANPAGLTERQIAILALLVDGLRNAEIAERLYLSPKTVEHHVSAIFAKLGVSSRVDATRIAIELGIASQSPPQKYAPLASER